MTKKHFLISAPGRTEISGNHTDHQRGCVLAAAVNLETVADVMLNGSNNIRVRSEGFPEVVVELDDLNIREEEKNTSAALVRGVAAAFEQLGARIKGFDAETHSTVLPGSGLSSSTAFEVLMGTICNELFFDRKLSPVEIAQIGQYAENVYFGKPSGLMDQAASSVGGMVYIDFADPDHPQVERIEFDFEKAGHALCIIDSGADHADLTDEYAAIPREQNISPAGATQHQEVAVALAMCDTLLNGRGAYRVHGGGFAGTVQAFVPVDMLEEFKSGIERVLGEGSCHVLHIRNEGGVRLS